MNKLQGRVHFGGALEWPRHERRQQIGERAAQADVSLIPRVTISGDEDLEWAVRLALGMPAPGEGAAEANRFGRVPQHAFSFSMGPDGVEKFVSTPELHSENSIGSDPLPAGQVWALSPGGADENPGLFRIEVTEGPGSGIKILNQSPPGPLKESVRCAEQNLYARAKQLVGDRYPRAHEFTIQFRAFDACKSASATGIPILLAMSSALVERNLEGGLVIVGGLNLGGSVEPIYNAVSIIELAADKGAQRILMPVAVRKQLFDLPDDLATKVTVVYYADARDALLKALSE